MNGGSSFEAAFDSGYRGMDDWRKVLQSQDDDDETDLPGLEGAFSHAHGTTIESYKHTQQHPANMLHIDDEDYAAISPTTAVDSPTSPNTSKWADSRDKWTEGPHQIQVRSRKISEGSTAVASSDCPDDVDIEPTSSLPQDDTDERESPSSLETPIVKMPPPTPPHITVGFQEAAVPAEADEENAGENTANSSENTNGTKRNRLVRFNSRVRISSGIHHHEPASGSSSCSSSISAPLRPSSGSSESPAAPSLNTYPRSRVRKPPSLDQILNPNAVSQWLIQKNMGSRRVRGPGNDLDKYADREGVDETTPILAAAARRRALRGPGPGGRVRGNYMMANGGIPRGHRTIEWTRDEEDADNDEEGDSDDEGEEGRGRSGDSRPIWQNDSKTEEDVLYGKWPARAINPKWWWWKIGTISCCSTPPESDYY
ncbi:hypothetical protein FRC03_008598 [Tulasnella sp. 419]|nr:hypothetical protein FRC03_008598 [Tulasnella sp. 419]